MIHAYADPAIEFATREAVCEERRATMLSRTEGRSVDGFGFSTNGEGSASGRDGTERRARNRESRKRRLQIARWWAQARREWEAEVAECRRRACQEFAVRLSVRDWAAVSRGFSRWPKDVARLLVTAVNMRPTSQRGEAKNGVELTLEVEACGKQATDATDWRLRGFTETFGWPSRSHKDGGKFANRRLARLGSATGVIRPEALGRVVPVGWQELVGRRLVAALRRETLAGEEGEIVLVRIDGLKMWPGVGL